MINSLYFLNTVEYIPSLLHTTLRPGFHNHALNNGVYERVSGKDDAISIYFYMFKATTAASSVTAAILETAKLLSDEEVQEIQHILPECDVTFQDFPVPKKFVGLPDLMVIIRSHQNRYKILYDFVANSAIHIPQSMPKPSTADQPTSSHETKDNSDEESGSEQQSPYADNLPYPYLGRPYVTNSILNTLDLDLVDKALKELLSAKLMCMQLTVADKHKQFTLAHLLFGDQAVSFSNTTG